MTTEQMLEEFLNKTCFYIKKSFRKIVPAAARALDRHESVDVNGEIYTYWKELICVNTAEILNKYCPEISIEVELDGNNSRLVFPEMTNDQIRHMTSVVYPMIQDWH